MATTPDRSSASRSGGPIRALSRPVSSLFRQPTVCLFPVVERSAYPTTPVARFYPGRVNNACSASTKIRLLRQNDSISKSGSTVVARGYGQACGDSLGPDSLRSLQNHRGNSLSPSNFTRPLLSNPEYADIELANLHARSVIASLGSY